MSQDITYLGESSIYTWKECIFCCCVECSLNVKLADSCSELLHLCWFCVYLFYSLLRDVFNVTRIFRSISSSFISFCFVHFKVFVCACTYKTVLSFWLIYPFIIILCSSLSLVILLVLKYTLSDINIAIPVFFWLVFAWYIFILIFAFNSYHYI